jgi:catechol 2,3-dioxygenase-like lactoylglutathione lyase family enzyme
MIVPNLMVTDMARAVAFYTQVLGMACTVAVRADRSVMTDGASDGAVFVTLEHEGAQLMLQTAASLAEELPMFSADQRPAPAGTVYMRGLDPDAVLPRAAPESVVKGPLVQWYGMRELYLRDPDGHVICCGVRAT